MSRLIIWPSMMLLGWTETKLWTLKHGSKSIQASLIFHRFCDNCKIPSCTYYLKEAEMKITTFAYFKEYPEIMKNFKSLYGFGGRCLNIWDVCMDFEPYFKVHNFVSVQPKSIILGQMINFDMIFHVVVSVYPLVKIWNSPQFPVEFQNGLFNHSTIQLFNHSFIHSFIHSIFQSFIRSIIHSIIHSALQAHFFNKSPFGDLHF